MLLRLLAIFVWLTASFSAHAESVRDHTLAGGTAYPVISTSLPDGDGTHCASACLASSLMQAKVSVESIAPEPNRAVLPAALIPAPVSFEPRLLPPVRAGPDHGPGRTAHLRDLSSTRLLI